MMYIAQIRDKAGRVRFQGAPADTHKQAALIAFRDGPKSATTCSVSKAYQDARGNWNSNGSDIRWFNRRDIQRDQQSEDVRLARPSGT